MTSLAIRSAALQPNSDPQKFIAFPIANHSIAVPLGNVLRVLRHTPDDSNEELHRMGLLPIGRHVIRALNLRQWLNADATSQSSETQSSETQSFIIIVGIPQQEPFGIWTEGLPDVVELSSDVWRSLSPSVSTSSSFLELISHTAVIPQKKGHKTIFLLDIAQALNARAPEAATLSPAF
ncbi:MAG: chemotaxis protein CheW [Leptolyngbya sp. SIO1D8]|nr:chemotaxis protein CheW [Leptolyngbya sp. SIO1D8]